MAVLEQKDSKERRYWRRWYVSLALWLIVLIIFFFWFTQFYK